MDLHDVDNPKDDMRYRAAEKGAAFFARPEGMWYDNNLVYFTCTSGGRKKLGWISIRLRTPLPQLSILLWTIIPLQGSLRNDPEN